MVTGGLEAEVELDHEEMVKNGKRKGRYTWKPPD